MSDNFDAEDAYLPIFRMVPLPHSASNTNPSDLREDNLHDIAVENQEKTLKDLLPPPNIVEEDVENLAANMPQNKLLCRHY